MVDKEHKVDILGEMPIGETLDGQPIYPSEDPVEAIHGVQGAQFIKGFTPTRVYPKRVGSIPPEHGKTTKAPGEVQQPLMDPKISPFQVDSQDPRIIRFNPQRVDRIGGDKV